MKSRLMLSLVFLFLYASVANAAFVTKLAATNAQAEKESKTSNLSAFNLQSFLSLSPKSYKQLTGKKLSLKDALSLKLAQKMLKKQSRKAEGGDLP